MPVCPEHLRLMADAERILSELIDLMHRQREAISDQHTNTLLLIDQEIERKFSEKERAMGALQQHRREHGC